MDALVTTNKDDFSCTTSRNGWFVEAKVTWVLDFQNPPSFSKRVSGWWAVKPGKRGRPGGGRGLRGVKVAILEEEVVRW